jgi:hypothetical protein
MRSGEIEMLIGRVGRFYRDGFRWAAAMPLPLLLRRNAMIPEIARRERG